MKQLIDVEAKVKEFKAVFEWIKMQCKDDIIAGFDINHIDERFKTILTQANKDHTQKMSDLREAVEGKKHRPYKNQPLRYEIQDEYNQALDNILTLLDTLEGKDK